MRLWRNFHKKEVELSGRNHKKVPAWLIGISLGVVFLVLGLGRNQFEEIYRKAVMICLECIGIG